MIPQNKNELELIEQMLDSRMRERYTGSDSSYSLWLSGMKLRSLDENTAHFDVDSQIKANFINSKLLDFISETLSSVVGYDPKITVGVDTSLAKPIEDDGTVISPLKVLKEREERVKAEEAALRQYEEENDDGEDDSSTPSGEKRLRYNDKYTFENFIVGNSNSFAHAAALNVAENAGKKAARSANPLFIWGPSGLGKTHLMYAIANRVLEKDSKKKVIYVKGEEFMNQLIYAIQSGKMREFRAKYRSVDMLLIDDIQYIAGADSTQREFFHTFDALYDDGKQIIITADRPPKDLTAIVDRIKSRFEAGLLADIQPPDLELRLAILKDKIIKSQLEITLDAVDFLAKNLRENVRQLEGVVNKLAMTNLLTGGTVNTEMVINTVPEYLRESEPVTDAVERIIGVVCRHFSVTPEDIKGTQKMKNIKDARNVAMYAIKEETTLSLSQIGEFFGRDHSTVHSNVNRVKSQMSTDPVFEAKVGEVMKEIKRKS